MVGKTAQDEADALFVMLLEIPWERGVPASMLQRALGAYDTDPKEVLSQMVLDLVGRIRDLPQDEVDVILANARAIRDERL